MVVPRQIKDQSIVIVEDDAAIREALSAYFGGRNTVKVFESSEAFLEAQAQFHAVDVFIIDYRLPGMDGVQLFQQLRAHFSSAKFILITGEMNYEVAEKTRQLGLTRSSSSRSTS